MTCPFCKAEIPDDSWFCDQCGKELRFCPDCGKPKKGTLCAACGADLVDAQSFFQTQKEEHSVLSLSFRDTRIVLREGLFGRTEGVFPEFASDEYVSRRHGEFRYCEGRWQVRDVGSTNGTFLNGGQLSPDVWTDIVPGDSLKIATTTYTIEL